MNRLPHHLGHRFARPNHERAVAGFRAGDRQAFEQLFAVPFGRRDVAAFERRTEVLDVSRTISTPAASRDDRKSLRLVTGSLNRQAVMGFVQRYGVLVIILALMAFMTVAASLLPACFTALR